MTNNDIIQNNETTEKLCIIVVTYNAEKWLEKCFNIFRHNKNVEILAIDNGSSDNTVSILKQNFQHVKVIETGENIGFGKANNIGLKYALNNNFGKVLLLNQDVWISETDIYKLINIQNENLDFYIVSPLHFNGLGNNLDKKFSNYLIWCAQELCNDAIVGKYYKKIYNSTYCNAACWLLSKKCLEEIGGFNPSFYHYEEDTNYLQRVFYNNKKLGIVPSCKCFHDRENRVPSNLFFSQFAIKYREQVLNPISDPNKNPIFKIEFLLIVKLITKLIINTLKLNFFGIKLYSMLLFKYLINRKQILKNRKISENTNRNFL